MLLWCCPKRKKNKAQSDVHELLIEKESKQAADHGQSMDKSRDHNSAGADINQQTVKSAQLKLNSDTKSELSNNEQKQGKGSEPNVIKTDSKMNYQNMGIMPSFGKVENARPFSPREFQKNGLTTKKSHLWRQQIKSDLIYFSLVNNNRIYMSYRLAKNQQTKEFLNGLDYFLSKSQDKMHLIVGKQSMINAKISTIGKYSQNLIIANYDKATIEQNIGDTQSIIMEDLRCIRWAGINSLIFMADSFPNFEEVRAYVKKVTKSLSWEELKKATFFFPAFLTLENISQILFPSLKQFVLNSILQKVSLDLAFQMQLIEGTNLDCCIIIKNRPEDAKQANSIYDHLKLSISFFGKQLCETTQRVFRDFYIQTREKTLKEYFDMKQFYQRNPAQFKLKVKEMKDLEPKLLTDLENSPILKQVKSEDTGFYYIINGKVREDIGRIFDIAQLQKKQIDTPVKKQWDDDATADDFKIVKTNKLDIVAKEELDRIDLDILGDDNDDDLNYKNESQGDQQIIIKVQQNKSYAKERKQEQDEKDRQSFNQNRCDRNHRYNRFE